MVQPGRARRALEYRIFAFYALCVFTVLPKEISVQTKYANVLLRLKAVEYLKLVIDEVNVSMDVIGRPSIF